MAGDTGALWTLQQFTTIAGKPWYALQEHSDAGIERQFTGYRHEMNALARKLRITPEELPPTTEQEFLSRAAGDFAEATRSRALPVTAEAYKALGLGMLNVFASVGVHAFDVTFTDLDGKKLEKRGFLPNRSIHALRRTIGPVLRAATAHQHNLIVRPRVSERAELVQLDDLTPEQARRLEHRAFMTLCTSPGNYQAWVAVSDPEPDFARRLRKGVGADPSASGATRISGSRNFKRKYGPEFPLVEITGSNLGLTQTRAQLQSAGLVAAKEQPAPAPNRVSPTCTGSRKWPSYTRCVQNAPRIHAGDDRPDISRADFTWCMTAIDWGWSIEDTAARLLQESSKAQENGENYALMTAQNAAGAVQRRRAFTHTRQ